MPGALGLGLADIGVDELHATSFLMLFFFNS